MRAYLLLPVLGLLAGCNWVMNVSGLAANANKAIGAACRQTGRSLEACYARNPEADKAQVYAGWREMQEYMVKNKLDTMTPPPDPEPPAPASAPAAAPPPSEHGDKPAAEGAQKKSDPAQGAIKPGHTPLTSAEADEMVKNDPQVEAILSTIRKQDKAEAKPVGPSSAEKRLLGLIKEQEAPPPAEESLGKPAPAKK